MRNETIVHGGESPLKGSQASVCGTGRHQLSSSLCDGLEGGGVVVPLGTSTQATKAHDWLDEFDADEGYARSEDAGVAYDPFCNTGHKSYLPHDDYLAGDCSLLDEWSGVIEDIDLGASPLVRRAGSESAGFRSDGSRVIIDWLSVVKPCDDAHQAADVALVMAKALGASKYGKGKNNYPNAWYGPDGMSVNFGYNQGKAGVFINLTGKNCEQLQVTGNADLFSLLSDFDFKPSRVDIAHDVFEGFGVFDGAKEAYKRGDFALLPDGSRGKGRAPRAKLIDSLDGFCSDGRTLYVGSLKARSKLTRIYEKGKQQGDALSNWVRIELSIYKKNRDIPLEVMMNPDEYFAGASRYHSGLLDAVGKTIPTVKRLLATLDGALKKLKKNAGSLIHTLRSVGFSDVRIVSLLDGGKLSKHATPVGIAQLRSLVSIRSSGVVFT